MEIKKYIPGDTDTKKIVTVVLAAIGLVAVVAGTVIAIKKYLNKKELDDAICVECYPDTDEEQEEAAE